MYSSVGFGGGSTYLALLLIWDVPYYIFPVLALICNIIVVSGNSINYIRAELPRRYAASGLREQTV